MKAKDLNCVKCIKDQGQRVLVKKDGRVILMKFLSHTRNWSGLSIPVEDKTVGLFEELGWSR